MTIAPPGGPLLLLAVAVGGAVGALARHTLAVWAHGWLGTAFPWGTLLVNVLGSFLLGAALPVLEATAAGPEVRALVAVGILGAFTTFSTFTWEALALLQQGALGRGGAYLVGSVVVGLAAVLVGLAAGAALVAARA